MGVECRAAGDVLKQGPEAKGAKANPCPTAANGMHPGMASRYGGTVWAGVRRTILVEIDVGGQVPSVKKGASPVPDVTGAWSRWSMGARIWFYARGE